MIKFFKRETVGGAIWFLIGAGICLEAGRLSLGTLNNPGPGLFPFMAGALLIMLSTILLIREGGKAGEEEAQPREALAGALRAGLVCVALISYAVTMDYVGFVIGTTLFLAFLLGVIVSERWYVVIGGSVFASLAIYTVFKTWLDSPLPAGLLGF